MPGNNLDRFQQVFSANMILSQNEHWDCRRFTFLNVCFSPKGAPLWASFCVEKNDYSMRDFAKDFYNSQAWKQCRKSFVSYRRGLCERCLSRGIYKPGEIVHHKIHLTPDNIGDSNISLSFDNLQLLCRDCHALMHKPEKRYKVDELGRIIPVE